MPWENNSENTRDGIPDIPAIIKKMGESFNTGKGKKPAWLLIIVVFLAVILISDIPGIIKKMGESFNTGKGKKPAWLLIIVVFLSQFKKSGCNKFFSTQSQ